MEKKIQTTIVDWGYIGIMENQMETIPGFWVLGFVMKVQCLRFSVWACLLGSQAWL